MAIERALRARRDCTRQASGSLPRLKDLWIRLGWMAVGADWSRILSAGRYEERL